MIKAARRLLIQACSRTKSPAVNLLPAIDRYNGPAFQLLRNYIRLQPDKARLVDLYILSAEYGLIRADKRIPDYDRCMTPARAQELRPTVVSKLKGLIKNRQYEAIFFNLGSIYWHALPSKSLCLPPAVIAYGSQGRRLSLLHDWLYSDHGSSLLPSSDSSNGPISICGTNVSVTGAQVLAMVRRMIANGSQCFGHSASWYVDVDGEHIAPKWLVSQVTGLPVSAFRTGQALRVLGQLRIQVKRL